MGFAAIAHAAKSNESPGRNGMITAPVSMKMMANKIKYVQLPNVLTMVTRCESPLCYIRIIYADKCRVYRIYRTLTLVYKQFGVKASNIGNIGEKFTINLLKLLRDSKFLIS